MKNIMIIAGSLVLKATAAPLVVLGVSTQVGARGLVKTGSVIHAAGERAELKGLKFRESGDIKYLAAKQELAKSRAERKADRLANAKEKAAQVALERAQRIQQLEMARIMREQLKDLDLTKMDNLVQLVGAFGTIPAQPQA